MAEHTCGQCYYFNWKTLLRKQSEPPECRLKHRLGFVFDTYPACIHFVPKSWPDPGKEAAKMCEWGHGRCTAPNTICPHWIGAICELDAAFYNFENVRCPKKPEGGGEG